MMHLKWSLLPDKTKAVIEMIEDQKVLGHIVFELPEFEDLISGLAALRAEMTDVVPTELDPGTRLSSVADPAWRTHQTGEFPGVLLALRHPGLGWLGNLLPPHEAQALAQSLMALSGGQSTS